MLGERLTEAGVDTETRTVEGVTHEFFGMGAVVPEAIRRSASRKNA